MRFIDAHIFIYAILKPKTALPEAVLTEKKLRPAAKEIFLWVNACEPVTATTMHITAVANVFKNAADLGFACVLVSTLLSKPTISVQSIPADAYWESASLAQKYAIRINDALALGVMEQQGVDKIYTFVRYFSQAPVHGLQK